MQADLEEQPHVLDRLLSEGREPVAAIAAAVRRRGIAFAVLAARGSSDNAARYGQYVLGVRNGLTAALAAPSLVTLYRARPRMGAALAVGLSQSGQSPDVVAVIEEARRQGAVTVAVTNDAASPLAQAAEWCLPLNAGPERAVPATKTYTAQLLAMAMLSAALDDDARAWEELARLPERVAQVLEACARPATEAAAAAPLERLLVVGRGYNLATAFEIALKLKETCGLLADPYSGADFRHGPVALLEEGASLLAVAPDGAGFADVDGIASLARERGVRLVAISDRPELLGRADSALPLPPGVPEWLSPLPAVVPGQLLTLALARARGRNADAPSGLRKVTLTR
jgi:glutamine---fructose-6-phosphate transaminase (isomerizing)